MSIEEGNKLIAEFMGVEIEWIKAGSSWIQGDKHYEQDNSYYAIPYYHNDWSLLMPVVEKIEKIHDDFHGYFAVYIGSNNCTIQGTKLVTTPENFHPAYFNDVTLNTKIESTWTAVIQFIQWYNNQQTKPLK